MAAAGVFIMRAVDRLNANKDTSRDDADSTGIKEVQNLSIADWSR